MFSCSLIQKKTAVYMNVYKTHCKNCSSYMNLLFWFWTCDCYYCIMPVLLCVVRHLFHLSLQAQLPALR